MFNDFMMLKIDDVFDFPLSLLVSLVFYSEDLKFDHDEMSVLFGFIVY